MFKLSILHIPSGNIIITENILSTNSESAILEYHAVIQYICSPIDCEDAARKDLRIKLAFGGVGTTLRWVGYMLSYIQTHSTDFPTITYPSGAEHIDWGRIVPEEFKLLSIINV